MPGGKIVRNLFYVCVLFAGMSSLVNLYEAPVATIQEKLKLNRICICWNYCSGWLCCVTCNTGDCIRLDGRSIYLYLPHLAQCSQQLCSSGLQERSLLLMLLMQVQISLLESGLYHLENMSLSHFHLLHLLQVLYLEELADGGFRTG